MKGSLEALGLRPWASFAGVLRSTLYYGSDWSRVVNVEESQVLLKA